MTGQKFKYFLKDLVNIEYQPWLSKSVPSEASSFLDHKSMENRGKTSDSKNKTHH